MPRYDRSSRFGQLSAFGAAAEGLVEGYERGLDARRRREELQLMKEQREGRNTYRDFFKNLPTDQSISTGPSDISTQQAGMAFGGSGPAAQTADPFTKLESLRAQAMAIAGTNPEESKKMLEHLDRTTLTGVSQKVMDAQAALAKQDMESTAQALNSAYDYLTPGRTNIYRAENGKLVGPDGELTADEAKRELIALGKSVESNPMAALDWLRNEAINSEERARKAGLEEREMADTEKRTDLYGRDVAIRGEYVDIAKDKQQVDALVATGQMDLWKAQQKKMELETMAALAGKGVGPDDRTKLHGAIHTYMEDLLANEVPTGMDGGKEGEALGSPLLQLVRDDPEVRNVVQGLAANIYATSGAGMSPGEATDAAMTLLRASHPMFAEEQVDAAVQRQEGTPFMRVVITEPGREPYAVYVTEEAGRLMGRFTNPDIPNVPGEPAGPQAPLSPEQLQRTQDSTDLGIVPPTAPPAPPPVGPDRLASAGPPDPVAFLDDRYGSAYGER